MTASTTMADPMKKSETGVQTPTLSNSEKNENAECVEMETGAQRNVYLEQGFSEEDANFMANFPEEKRKKVIKKVSHCAWFLKIALRRTLKSCLLRLNLCRLTGVSFRFSLFST